MSDYIGTDEKVERVPPCPKVINHAPDVIRVIGPEAGAVGFEMGVQLRIAAALERIADDLEARSYRESLR